MSFVLAGISSKDDYALRALFDLAQQQPGIPIRIAKISERQHIPQKFLELILAELKRGGFVESWRGVNGGYSLSRPPDRLTVGEILRFVKGSKNSRRNEKPTEDNPFTALWRQTDARISEILDKTTFSDLVRQWQDKQSHATPNWVI
ncbi:MAG: Rrf2 family transcriptional regulator [Acidobacteriota bacterium]|nr:Rrf2 family transcriptional regulator [Acidobacteriota bacterium]